MGDKISQLPSATTLTGTELVPVVQGGTTKQTTSAAFKTTNAADLTTGTVATARLPVGSQVNPGILQLGSLSGQACEATDARLSNSRTPSGAASGDLTGSYPNPQLAASGVVAGTYGNSTTVPQITVDAKGRLTTVGQASIPIPQPSNDVPLPDGVAGSGNSQQFARADHIHQASSTTLTGDVTGTGTGSVSTTLSNTGVAQGTYGSSTRIPIVTVDAKGRVLAANTVPFSSAAGGTVTSVDVDGGTTGITTSGGPITGDGTITLDGVLTVAHGGTGATDSVSALSSLGAIPLSLVGVSSGVAGLDSNGLVPLSQLPNMVTGSYATLDGNGKVPLAQLYAGSSNGLATLDGAGKVPSGQLPSYVDDVVEVANFAALPNPGETGKIYITLDTNLSYRWSGSTYVQINAGPTPSSTTPLVAGTAAVGTSLTYARADHVHPSQVGSATPLVASGSGSIGTSTLFARQDHVHPLQPVPSASSTTPLVASGSGSVGTGTTYARADHVHPAQQLVNASTNNPQSNTASITIDASTQSGVTFAQNASQNFVLNINNLSTKLPNDGDSCEIFVSIPMGAATYNITTTNGVPNIFVDGYVGNMSVYWEGGSGSAIPSTTANAVNTFVFAITKSSGFYKCVARITSNKQASNGQVVGSFHFNTTTQLSNTGTGPAFLYESGGSIVASPSKFGAGSLRVQTGDFSPKIGVFPTRNRNSYCIEFFFRLDKGTVGIIGEGDIFYITPEFSGGGLYVLAPTSSWGATTFTLKLSSPNSIVNITKSFGAFIHFAFVKNAGTYSWYVDGVAQTPAPADFGDKFLENLLAVFTYPNDTTAITYFNEFRVTVDNPVYTANFTPPTTQQVP